MCMHIFTNYHKLVLQSLKHLNTATSTLASRFVRYPRIAVTTQASTPASRLRLHYIHAVKDLLVGWLGFNGNFDTIYVSLRL